MGMYVLTTCDLEMHLTTIKLLLFYGKYCACHDCSLLCGSIHTWCEVIWQGSGVARVCLTEFLHGNVKSMKSCVFCIKLNHILQMKFLLR